MTSHVAAVVAISERRAVNSPFAPASARVHVMLLAAAASVALLFAMRGFSLPGPDFPVVVIAAGLLLLVAWCGRARGFDRVATAVETWTLLAVFCILATLLSYVAGASGAPLIDGELAAADGWILPGVDWPTAMRAAHAHPWLIEGANACYASIRWQPTLLLLALAATGRGGRCWTFLLAWMTTLLLVVTITAFLPALGPYVHHGVRATALPAMSDPAPWVTPGVVTALRDGSLRAIGFADLEGIITFPSFHAGAAVLLGWAFWPIRLLRWPMATLNAAMLLAAVPIGGHYFVDLPAGVAVAAAGIWLAIRWQAARSAPSIREGGWAD